MAKRFTDTDKWRKPWFRALSLEARTAWGYLTDNCDKAGIWPAAFDLMSSDVGFAVDANQIKAWFGEKLVCLGDRYFIPSFIEFQYGELSTESKPHASVIKTLIKNGIDPKKLVENRGYPKGIDTLEDKEEDKDKEEEREGKQNFPGPYQTAAELWHSQSIIAKRKIEADYPDQAWVGRQVALCFDHFTAEPKETPRTAGKWAQKLRSWLESGWIKRKSERKSQGTPETGGWSHIDGVG